MVTSKKLLVDFIRFEHFGFCDLFAYLNDFNGDQT